MHNRPYSWRRLAVKIVGKYGNDEWLGPDGICTEQTTVEWSVVYHGREILRANPILKETVKPGPRALYGEGIHEPRHYAQEFTREGKYYKMLSKIGSIPIAMKPKQGPEPITGCRKLETRFPA